MDRAWHELQPSLLILTYFIGSKIKGLLHLELDLQLYSSLLSLQLNLQLAALYSYLDRDLMLSLYAYAGGAFTGS